MTVEIANRRIVPKPWGAMNLGPWSTESLNEPVGEIWFERPGPNTDNAKLLLKILFTEQQLSIQVHPDDTLAHSAGLPRGKTEAWYVLSAEPDAKIVAGLKHKITVEELRAAVADGSLPDMVAWHRVRKDDLIYIPAGTVHTIGPGLVIAEIQQRSDVTYRLYDYGRKRQLHIDEAIAAVDLSYEWNKNAPENIDKERTLLVKSPHFVIERLELPPFSEWEFSTQAETWIFAVSGDVRSEDIELATSDAVYLEAETRVLTVGPEGLTALMFYCDAGPVLIPATQNAGTMQTIS